jgi:hypothetical protein
MTSSIDGDEEDSFLIDRVSIVVTMDWNWRECYNVDLYVEIGIKRGRHQKSLTLLTPFFWQGSLVVD